MKRSVFRQVSLERLSSPEQLDQLMQVTQSRSWLALGGLLILLVSMGIWGALATIPIEVTTPALLLPEGGLRNAYVVDGGQLQEVQVSVGDAVAAEDSLALVASLDGSDPMPVRAPLSGEVVEVRGVPGALVQNGQALITLAPAGAPLTALAYVPPDVAQRLQEGMLVKLAPNNVRTEDVGYLLGVVKSVSDFPSSAAGVASAVGSTELAGALMQFQTPLAVEIGLIEDASSPSGYRWTGAQGPSFPLAGVTLSTMTVVVEEKRPLELVFKR